jgi:hypothetical protein
MRRRSLTNRGLVFLTMAAFVSGLAAPPRAARAQGPYSLPVLPGALLALSAAHDPAMMLGVTVNLSNPFEFDFIISRGDRRLRGDDFEEESKKLIKYFLAALTVPEAEMWVNLSPYEPDRIIPERFGYTEMGRDLLAQDYILKQLTAALMFPEKEPGATFWEKVYAKARLPAAGGRENQSAGEAGPVADLLSRVWIVPEEAVVYEHDNSAFVVSRHLKVMLEEDYLSDRRSADGGPEGFNQSAERRTDQALNARIVKEILIPEIEREVNEGEHFANLRQIFNSMILAAWYKRALKETLLSKIYIDRHKTLGVEAGDKEAGKKIYRQYLEAFRKGVFNYIKEDYDPVSQQIIPRRYFSGGVDVTRFSGHALTVVNPDDIRVDSGLTDKMGEFADYVENNEVVEVKTTLNKSSSRDKFWEVMRRITLAGFIGFAACTGGCAFNKDYVKFDNPQSFVEAGLVDRRAEPSAPVIEVRSLDDLVKYDAGYPPGLYRVGGYDPAKPVMVVIHGANNLPSRHEKYLQAFAPDTNVFVFKYKTFDGPVKNADLLRSKVKESIAPLGNPRVGYLTFSHGGNIFMEAVRREMADNKPENIFSGNTLVAVGHVWAGSRRGKLVWMTKMPEPGMLLLRVIKPGMMGFFKFIEPNGKVAREFLRDLPEVLYVLESALAIVSRDDDNNPSAGSSPEFAKLFEDFGKIMPTIYLEGRTHTDLLYGDPGTILPSKEFFEKTWSSGKEVVPELSTTASTDGAMLGGGNVKFEEPISDLNLEAIDDLNLEAIDIDPKVFDFRIDPSRSFYAMVDALKLEIPKLAERLKQQGRRQVEVLDVGTGSGVLGLFIFHEFRKYGIKVGFVAVDIDRRAVWNARDNFLKYGVPADVYPVAPDQDLSDVTGGRRFDLIVFNAPDPVPESESETKSRSESEAVSSVLAQVRMPLKQLLARVEEFRGRLLAPDGVALVGGHESKADSLEINPKEQYVYGKKIDAGRRVFRFTPYGTKEKTGPDNDWHRALMNMDKTGENEKAGSKEEVGGIDFNPSRMDLRIRRDASGVPLPVELQDLPNIHIDGLYPVIINITPVFNPLPLLGLSSSGPGAPGPESYQRI